MKNTKTLKAMINKNRKFVCAISDKTGINKQAIYNWADGRSCPSIRNAILIEKATRGKISVYDWI